MEPVNDHTYADGTSNSLSAGGTISPAAVCFAMKPEKLILAAAMLMASGIAAPGQENRTGTVTVLDRLHGSVTIRQEQGGTADAGGVITRYRAPAKLLENVHAGDKVRFSVTGAKDTRTITKIEAQ